MTDINEMVSPPEIAGNDTCPFDHKKQPVVARKNVFPPAGGKNDAAELAKNLGEDYHFFELQDIEVKGKAEKAMYAAHHLIPGNASWKKTSLKKWVDKKHGHIVENIGYDVNGLENGVSLPGWYGIKYGEFGKPWGKYKFQRDYAFACMKHSGDHRQFHDSHSTYSKFVVKVLNKISEKLDAKVRNKTAPGCKHKDCAGGKTNKKKFDPPVNLVRRLDQVALRLEGYLIGRTAKNWKLPIYTSKWALAYKNKVSAQEASQILSDTGGTL